MTTDTTNERVDDTHGYAGQVVLAFFVGYLADKALEKSGVGDGLTKDISGVVLGRRPTT